jgi:hypothetical protein
MCKAHECEFEVYLERKQAIKKEVLTEEKIIRLWCASSYSKRL